jgi:hypothetical protein
VARVVAVEKALVWMDWPAKQNGVEGTGVDTAAAAAVEGAVERIPNETTVRAGPAKEVCWLALAVMAAFARGGCRKTAKRTRTNCGVSRRAHLWCQHSAACVVLFETRRRLT